MLFLGKAFFFFFFVQVWYHVIMKNTTPKYKREEYLWQCKADRSKCFTAICLHYSKATHAIWGLTDKGFFCINAIFTLQKNTTDQITTMAATSINVLISGHNHHANHWYWWLETLIITQAPANEGSPELKLGYCLSAIAIETISSVNDFIYASKQNIYYSLSFNK